MQFGPFCTPRYSVGWCGVQFGRFCPPGDWMGGLWEEFFHDLWIEIEDATDLTVGGVVPVFHFNGDAYFLVWSENGGTRLIEGFPA